jgi:hypothetical protein
MRPAALAQHVHAVLHSLLAESVVKVGNGLRRFRFDTEEVHHLAT